MIKQATIEPLTEETNRLSGKIVFSLRIERDELDGGFIAECLDLPGCMSQGETEEEALDNLADALFGVLEARMQRHLHDQTFEFDSTRAHVPDGERGVRTIEVAV